MIFNRPSCAFITPLQCGASPFPLASGILSSFLLVWTTVHYTGASSISVFFFCLPQPTLPSPSPILIFRWDLKMGQRGLLDRLPVAHTAPITTMDWYSGGEEPPPHAIAISNPSYMPDDYTGNTLGWVATAGLDHCVKVIILSISSGQLILFITDSPPFTLDLEPYRTRSGHPHAKQTYLHPSHFIPYPSRSLAARI